MQPSVLIVACGVDVRILTKYSLSTPTPSTATATPVQEYFCCVASESIHVITVDDASMHPVGNQGL